MKLDSGTYHGYFNFYLGPTYAVDEELYRYVTLAAAQQSTAVIARTIRSMAYERYYADFHLYLSAVGTRKIKKPRVHVSFEASQEVLQDEVYGRLLR